MDGHEPAAGLAAAARGDRARPGRRLPAQFTYLNFGKVTQKGLELGVDSAVNRY